MNYRRIIAGLLLLGSVAAMLGFAGTVDDPIAKIIAQLGSWYVTNPQEKVYLQLDKPYYAIGDDIWFKAYITTGSEHKLSTISGVLNVELINDKDSVKQSIKLPVINGLAWGDFALADSLKEGNYRIRAYTNWMRNAGPDYFFDKTITVQNAVTNKVFTKTNYTFSTENGRQNVNATINYTNLEGTPYHNANVIYEVELASKIIAKGKGLTDDKGNLNISFVSNAAGNQDRGRIITHIQTGGKESVEKSVLINALTGKVDVQFFPEGGNLVVGNDSKIAFKAVGADGLGKPVKGIITDDQNNQVATFSTSNLGMGEFNILPENGKTYKAHITYADGSENTVPLSAASNAGYTLDIDNSGVDKIGIKIIPGQDVIANTVETGELCLIAQSGGVVYWAGKSKAGIKSFTASVAKSKFPTGIVQFTLFSPASEPLNERLVFIQNHDQLKLGVTTDQQTYQPRQKVKIELEASDKTGKPMVGSFSVAVTNESKVPVDEADESTILSNLLLTSDLKGYIEKPNYYFSNENEKTASDLDILMLTQGYRRFDWKQVLNDSYPPVAYQPETALTISGHVKNLLGRPVANGKITLFSKSGGTFLIDTVSDSKGNFVFKNLVFRDSIKFVIQARNARDGKNVEVELDNISIPKVGANKNAPDLQVNIGDVQSPFLQNSKNWYAGQVKYGFVPNSILLKEVEIKATKMNPAEHSSNLNGPGNADQVIAGSDIAGGGCAQLMDCLQGRLFGVKIMNGVPFLIQGGARPMEVLIDGMHADSDVFNNLNPFDIESIEVLKSIAYLSIYGGRGGSGILVITTKRGGGDYSVHRYAPGVVTYSPKGYYKARTFYSPQYDDPKTNQQIPDLRSTIYWKPNVITSKDGKTSFEYFNADTKGTYKVVVEGIDADGNLGRQVFRYKVE